MKLETLLTYLNREVEPEVPGQATYVVKDGCMLRFNDPDEGPPNVPMVIESITIVEADGDEEGCVAMQIAFLEDAIARTLDADLPIMPYFHL